jgi:hypothetical protein
MTPGTPRVLKAADSPGGSWTTVTHSPREGLSDLAASSLSKEAEILEQCERLLSLLRLLERLDS